MMRLESQGVKGAADILNHPSETDYFANLLEHGPAFAGVVDEGVVCAVGMVEQNPGNFRCWAVTDPELTSKHFLRVNRGILAFFAEHPARRIETIVQAENIAGVRWVVNILGFSYCGYMSKFNEYGDCLLYERV